MTISDEQAGGIGAIKGLSEWWSGIFGNILSKNKIKLEKILKTIISVPGH